MIYLRYVDNIFAIFNSENKALLFFEYVNNKNKNIKFTIENENIK